MTMKIIEGISTQNIFRPCKTYQRQINRFYNANWNNILPIRHNTQG